MVVKIYVFYCLVSEIFPIFFSSLFKVHTFLGQKKKKGNINIVDYISLLYENFQPSQKEGKCP